MCMVAPGGCAWLLWGQACVVALGGHAWLLPRACVEYDEIRRYGDTINEQVVRILLGCILVP